MRFLEAVTRSIPKAPLLALTALAVSTACTTPSSSDATGDTREAGVAREWEHSRSDIPVDPRIRFGHLSNGLRWAWAANTEPKDRCYLRLHVDVGSLAEEEHEQGLAHFLEHMAFNGSKNFEAGTLIEWFQGHGMAFGADTNASTGFSETIYKLDLPQSDEETLREGLLVLRDFADGLLLEGEEIENEKGVIDGEQRERDSASYRMLIKQLETMFDGTRLANRIPIGLEEVRAEFDAEIVRGFYREWYRPENMTLVAVGDLGDLDPAPLFAEFFSDMPVPNAPVEKEPDIGEPKRLDHVFAIYEDEVPWVSVSIELLKPYEKEPVTIAEWVEDIPLQYARKMVNLRFSELAKEESAPFLSAGLSSASAWEIVDGERLAITASPDKWQEALAFCEKELRRALAFGFQEAELDEVRANTLRALDEAVERESTAHSLGLVSEILTAAEDEYVPTDAETDRDVVRPALEALTVADCFEALSDAWSEGELSIYATGNADLGDDAADELMQVYLESASEDVDAGEAIVVAEFAYASDPSRTGEIVERETIEDLDFVSVRFANGVAVNVKSTDFKEKQILVSARLGEGRLTLAPDEALVEWVASRVLGGAGLEAHSEDELRRLTAGKDVGVGFSIDPDRFVLGGRTTAEDLLLECELMCAYLTAPGWREDGLVQLRRALPLYFEQLEHQHQGPIVKDFIPALFANDPRFRHPALAEAAECGMDRVEDWLAPVLSDAPLEVTFVGDLDVDETLAIAARTLGTLPPRRDYREYEERRVAPTPKSGLTQEHGIETEVPKSLVMIAFPATDGLDPVVRRRFTMLENVLNDRLRIEVREKLGASYSPGAGLELSRTYPNVGLLFIQAMSDPEKVDDLVEACLAVANSLATDGVTTEELDRLRVPILKRRRDAKRTNGYWMDALKDTHSRPASLDEVRSADAFYEDVGAQDISSLAATYLARDRASVLVVNPKADEASESDRGDS